MGRIQCKRLDQPDDVRDLGGVSVNILRFRSVTVGYGTVQPGWRWSTHMVAATDQRRCQIHHVQLVLSGRFAVEMDDGEYAEIGPNEITDVPPGHDVWVVGDEPVTVLDFGGNIEPFGQPTGAQREVTTLLMSEHRRLDGDGQPTRRRGVEADAGRAQPGRPEPPRPLPRQGGAHDRRRVPGNVHQRGRRDPMWGVDSSRHCGDGLVDDRELRFESKGRQQLKGIPTPLEVFVVADSGL